MRCAPGLTGALRAGGLVLPGQSQAGAPRLTGSKECLGWTVLTLVLMKAARGPLPSSAEVLSPLLRDGATIWPVVRSM